MNNVRTIYADWYGGSIWSSGAGTQLAYQHDHLSDMIIFKNAPELENYYLIVSMKETEDGDAKTMEPIQLGGSFWLIPNVYTQIPQTISFQVCCRTESGDFEQHSAQFSGVILPSMKHDGEALDVDPTPMFDAYKQWVSDIAMAAGAIVIDPTLSVQGAAADAKAVGDAVDELNGRLDQIEGGGGGLTSEVKEALLACFSGVAWRGDVDPDALYSALDTALNPPASLTSISAVYTQSGAVDVGASLDSLKADLVITAHYSDSTSAVVTAYTLSGSLSDVGTNTITVSYGGKTTTFTVNVTSSWTYVWDLTDSLTDKISARVAVASAGSGVDAPAITNNGLAFTAATQILSLGDINLTGKIIEIDVVSMDFKGSASAHIRFLSTMLANGAVGIGPVIYHKDSGWAAYIRSGTASSPNWTTTWTSTKDRNLFSAKTVKLVSGSESTELYLDGELLRSLPKFTYEYGNNVQNLCIAGLPSYAQSGGDQCYDMVISGIRIKDVEEA